MSGNGWISLHRELLNKAIWRDSSPEHKTVLITLLMMCNHARGEWMFRGKKYICDPGQIVTSLNKISVACGRGISIQNIRSALNRFEKLGFLTKQTTKVDRLITICNWAYYQSSKEATNKATNKEPTKQNEKINKAINKARPSVKATVINKLHSAKKPSQQSNQQSESEKPTTNNKDFNINNSGGGGNIADEKSALQHRAKEWLNVLSRVSNLGGLSSENSKMPLVLSDCREYSDSEIEKAIQFCGRDAEGWGLIHHYLPKIRQQAQAEREEMDRRYPDLTKMLAEKRRKAMEDSGKEQGAA